MNDATEQAIRDVRDRLDRHEDSVWDAIKEIREKLDRLPPWGSVALSVLTFLLGVAVTCAISFAVKR